MEPESLLRRPQAAPTGNAPDFTVALRAALEQFAAHLAEDTEAVDTACSVVQPLLHAYGERIPIEQWRDWQSQAVRRHLETGGHADRGLIIIDGMGRILSEPRTAREHQRWLLNAEARRHQVCLAHDAGLLLLAWKPAPIVRRGRFALDHWRAAVRPLSSGDLLANYPIEAFLHGLQEALTRRVERSRQWADFIRELNREFDRLLG